MPGSVVSSARKKRGSWLTAKIDDKINEGMIRSGIREKVINFENINVETYPSIQFTSTDHYPQLSAKEISPGPPAAMPVMDYSDEQKQIPDITDQSHGTSFDYTNFATTETIGNDEINYGAQVEYTYGTESKTTTTGTTVTATTSVVLPYTVQVVD
ncbi:unnamed protein product, partial [Onchocerca ochengi]|uniref:Mub_B2 domain-containing protein n=1 Tax=Onchocerca ochengi TaxID=42157 RepID=A0A182ESP1_ONCOC